MFLSFLRMQHFQVRLRSKKITHSKTANKILCKNPEKTVVRSLRTTPTRFVWKICKNSKNINVQNFIGLVLFCIDAKFCKKIFVGKLFTRSRRFACFCTAQTSIYSSSRAGSRWSGRWVEGSPGPLPNFARRRFHTFVALMHAFSRHSFLTGNIFHKMCVSGINGTFFDSINVDW